MKSAILGKNGFTIMEEPIPAYGKDELLVKSAGCGICEGDVFRYRTRNDAEQRKDETGIHLGHEGSGVIAAIGADVTGFKVGDKVTALGGAYAEYFVAKADMLAIVPDEIPVSQALGEPIACCMSGARRFGVEIGDRVGIIGAGYMGMNMMMLARLRGASEVVVFDLIDWRLDWAAKLGADRVVNTAGKSPKQLHDELGDFDVMMEATGVQGAIDLATELLRNHGTFDLVGYHQSNMGMRSIDMKIWNFKALNVQNCHIRNDHWKFDDMKASLRMIAKGKLNTRALVTDYKFEDINLAFTDLTSRKPGLFKANLVF